MTKGPLSIMDYTEAAKALGCETAVIRAVDAVESSGRGFYPTGEPIILFEKHYFSRLTKGKFDKIAPDVSFPTWKPGTYGPSSAQHKRLQKAISLDPNDIQVKNAALMSCSWGRYQIMGSHFARCGCKDIQEFINKMYKSEQSQLSLFVQFIKSNRHIQDAMVRKDFVTFARLYNGPGYKRNNYDVKLLNAYKSFK